MSSAPQPETSPSTSPSSSPSSSSGRKPRRDDVLEVDVERLDARGRGVGRATWDGETYVVTLRALPGQRVRARVAKRRRNQLEARVVEELVPSPDVVPARCPHYPSCGGCAFQDFAYEAQLAELHHSVQAAFEAHDLLSGSLQGRVEVQPVVPAPNVEGYRNKMEFGFATRRWLEPHELADAEASAVPPGELALGLHARGFFGKVIDLDSCAIHPPVFDDVVRSARRLARERGLSAWDVREHKGLLRHLALRAGRRTGDLMLYLVTTTESPELVDPFVRALIAERPELTTVVQGITDRLSTVAVGDVERVLFGPGTIRERCLELDFEISPTSFFQTNTEQAERLFTMAREEATLGEGGERPLVWDLYCGTGSLTLALAGDARHVVGFEQVAPAVANARRNAQRNGIENVEFVEGDVLDLISELIDGERARERPDIVVVDPPRAGLHPKVPGRLAALAPERIVYVSCNPSSAARDVKELVALGYELACIRPIDLFPHTPHVECVIRLERRGLS